MISSTGIHWSLYIQHMAWCTLELPIYQHWTSHFIVSSAYTVQLVVREMCCSMTKWCWCDHTDSIQLQSHQSSFSYQVCSIIKTSSNVQIATPHNTIKRAQLRFEQEPKFTRLQSYAETRRNSIDWAINQITIYDIGILQISFVYSLQCIWNVCTLLRMIHTTNSY